MKRSFHSIDIVFCVGTVPYQDYIELLKLSNRALKLLCQRA